MAAVAQEAEIVLAQRLASNEKPVRTKALKMLRKYFNLRSQKADGGFSSEDLLKIWKGLFYCLWMQDKPLLQEELSHRISGLVHSFHTTQTQLLYFGTFLQTVKREWDGIDRLRMDKFFQLVRFVFRQVFEVLKRRDWETSVVDEFLKVFTEQLLQSSARVPKGLMLHILDLYMTELAQVGSAELTAEQNLTFIGPFCRTMAKTKDRLLLTSISKNIFRTIVDHAPYAIEDLMRDLERGGGGGGEDSDSGQASGEEEEEDELKNNTLKKTNVKKVNGVSEVKGNGEVGTDDLDSDSVGSAEDDGVGPVLQFDYGAIADRLFELGSHMNTRNFNRTRMYRLVKTFRDLSEGLFPEVDEDVSDESDEFDVSDDELFQKKSKKKKKRKSETLTTQEEETAAKKVKACPEDGSLKTAREKLKLKPCVEEEEEPDGEHQTESGDAAMLTPEKSKKKNKKKKMNAGDTESCAQPDEKHPEDVSEDTDACSMARKKKRKTKKPCSSLQEVVEDIAVQEHHAQKVDEDDTPAQNHQGTRTAKTKRGKRKNLKSSLQEVELSTGTLEGPDKASSEELEEHLRPASEEDLTTPCRLKGSSTKNKKSKTLVSSSQEVATVSQGDGAGDTPAPAVQVLRTKKSKKMKTPSQLQVDAGEPEASSNGVHVSTPHHHDACCQPQSVNKAKKKKQLPEAAPEPAAVQEASTPQTETPRRQKKVQKKPKAQSVEDVKEEPVVKGKAGTEEAHDDISTSGSTSGTPVNQKKGKKKRKLQTGGAETPERNTDAEDTMSGKKVKVSQGGEASTPVTLKKLKMDKTSPKSDFVSFQGLINPPTPLFCKTKSQPSTPRTSIKAKLLTPKSESKKVTFGLKNNKTAEFRKTDRSLLLSPAGSSRVAFDPKKKPVSGVLKSPSLSPVISVKKPAAKRRATAADFF